MKVSKEDLFKKVVSHAKEYGFVFPSSEIYDGLGAVYDYGQNGVELKKNIREYWWKSMVQMHENIVGIDSAIFMHPSIWKASGHVDGFSDPMIDNKDSKKRYRADQLLEDKIEWFKNQGLKIKSKYQNGIITNHHDFTKINTYEIEAKNLEEAFEKVLNDNDLPGMKALIELHEIACPVSGTRNWTDVRQFNLMYSTQMGSLAEDADTIYLRPETAQGIFVNFLNVQKTGRMKIPFGIAQTGKAFRNEIVARQFIMRMREFEQMEMQFFVRPGTEMQWFDYWKETRLKWHKNIGTDEKKYRFHDHVKLAHYANAAVDIEYDFPFGFKEVEGIHSRTDFDLAQHQKHSGKKIQYFDSEINQNYTPYVVETSIGLDRFFLLQLCENLKEEEVKNGDNVETRTVLNLHPCLSPVKVAVFPLIKRDGLPEKAREIMKDLQMDHLCFYEEKDAIGKRYRRQDAIGTPFCVTIDHDTLSDNMVTIRHRDTMLQERVNISALPEIVNKKVSWKNLL